MLEGIERFAIARVEPVGRARIAWRSAVAVGRVLLALIFVAAGFEKLFAWNEPLAMIAAEGLRPAALFLGLAIALELLGGISVFTGLYTRIGVILLLLFLVPTTLIVHDFWNYAGAERQLQLVHFLKNVSIMGGLLILFGVGAGALSVDSRLAHDHPPPRTDTSPPTR